MTAGDPRPGAGDTGFGMRFALASLATWRVTHLLAEEDGPADLVVRVRARLGSSRLGDVMDCFYCLSVWVAAPVTVTVVRRRRDAPLTWLALSGSACLLERVTRMLDRAAASSEEAAAATTAWEARGGFVGQPAEDIAS